MIADTKLTIIRLTVFSLPLSRCSNRNAPPKQYATTNAINMTCENRQVKTFHDTHRHEMHLLRGAGSSRSNRRVDILLYCFLLLT